MNNMIKVGLQMALWAPLANAELVELNQGNFQETIEKGNVLVKFFAPWCGHCSNMQTGYVAAADALEGQTNGRVAELNCDQQENKVFMQKYGVRGFPTLLWFDEEGKHHPYTSGRDQASIEKFVLENATPTDDNGGFNYKKYINKAKRMSNDTAMLIHKHGKETLSTVNNWLVDVIEKSPAITISEAPTDHGNDGLVSLTPENIYEVIARKNVLVKFFAPWCGHCKNMAATYEELAKEMHAENKQVTIAEYDCTQPGSDAIKKTFGLTGFPTIMWFPAVGQYWEYNGRRSKESFSQLVRTHTGDATLGLYTRAIAQEVGGHAYTMGKPVIDFFMEAYDETAEFCTSCNIMETVNETVDNISVNVGRLFGVNPLIKSTGMDIDEIIAAKNAFIRFHAPWCGHCKQMKKGYESAAEVLHKKYPDVQIVDFDCTEANAGAIVCAEHGIKGYPTMKWVNLEGKLEDYKGKRTEKDIIDFVSEKMDAQQEGHAMEDDVASNDVASDEKAHVEL